MCGKFTSYASWTEIVDFIHAAPPDEMANEEPIAFRVMSDVPIILWDHVNQRRRVVPMRWGFPDPRDLRRPRPIHARAETVDTTQAFAGAFRDGQRGIVLVNTFNEAPDSGAQHTITPAGPSGIAFVWRKFDGAGLPAPLFACVMVTVRANALIAALPTDRMPAVLAPEDWAVWLGEQPAPLADVKACLRTAEDVRWTMAPEKRARRTKPVVSDPGGLF